MEQFDFSKLQRLYLQNNQGAQITAATLLTSKVLMRVRKNSFIYRPALREYFEFLEKKDTTHSQVAREVIKRGKGRLELQFASEVDTFGNYKYVRAGDFNQWLVRQFLKPTEIAEWHLKYNFGESVYDVLSRNFLYKPSGTYFIDIATTQESTGSKEFRGHIGELRYRIFDLKSQENVRLAKLLLVAESLDKQVLFPQ